MVIAYEVESFESLGSTSNCGDNDVALWDS